MQCAAIVVLIAIALATGCSSRDEIHCVTLGSEAMNPLMQGASLCFETRAACDAFQPDPSSGLTADDVACMAVPAPAWHCSGFDGARDPVPLDTCLPSRALCETMVAGKRAWEQDGFPRATPCRAVPTVACAIDDARSMVCQSTTALCEASNDMIQKTMTPPPPPRRCELRGSVPR